MTGKAAMHSKAIAQNASAPKREFCKGIGLVAMAASPWKNLARPGLSLFLAGGSGRFSVSAGQQVGFSSNGN
jgi:hypothetical protein